VGGGGGGVDEIVKLTPEPPQPARNVAKHNAKGNSSIRRELKNVDFKIDYGTLAKASIDS
jgi:hypothetical protein